MWGTAANGRMRPTDGCAPATRGGTDFSLSAVFLSLWPNSRQPAHPEIRHRRRMPLFGQTHANQPIPKYVTGDECLFCHRAKVADTWEKNPHARTVHPRDDSDQIGRAS